MKHTVRNALLAVALATAGTVATTTPAEAATVLNRFQRSCYWWGCSSFVQTNGAYVPYIGSACVTRHWWGYSTYYVGAYRRC